MKGQCRIICFFLVILLTLSVLSGCSSQKKVDASLSDISQEMYSASWWISKTKKSDTVLLDTTAIRSLNEQIAVDASCGHTNLATYPQKVTSIQLHELLGADTLPSQKLFDTYGRQYDPSFLEQIQAAICLSDSAESVNVRYAIAAQDTALRAFPVADAAYATGDRQAYDLFQAGILRAGAPVAVLYAGLENAWFYVQTQEALGWVPADALLFLERKEWEEYLNRDEYLIITDSSVTPVYCAAEEIVTPSLTMGTKLPLCTESELEKYLSGRTSAGCYAVKYPFLNEDGITDFTVLLIPYSEDVHTGYLPYTKENLLTQALKLSGQGTAAVGENGIQLLQTLFSVFGIHLPGTIDSLRSIRSLNTVFGDLSVKDQKETLQSLECGSLLFFENEVALVLGTVKKVPYILLPLREYYENDERISVNAAVVTTLDLVNRKDEALSERITQIKILSPSEDASLETTDTSSKAKETTAATVTTTVTTSQDTQHTTAAIDQRL